MFIFFGATVTDTVLLSYETARSGCHLLAINSPPTVVYIRIYEYYLNNLLVVQKLKMALKEANI